jgi:ElaB/YqjD/DUF883 family membrane-anchored ribosome-binding protein
MNWNQDEVKPSIANERSVVVDDGEVIDSTLPNSPTRPVSARVKEQYEHAVEATRGYVAERPLHATLIAATGGAVLTGLLLLLGKQRHAPQRKRHLRHAVRMPWLTR